MPRGAGNSDGLQALDLAAETQVATGSAVIARSSDVVPAGRASQDAPAQLGDYQVLEIIGVGGMGVVHRGQHLETQQFVALKTVKVERPSLADRLRREIGALGRVNHPGVIRVLAEGMHAGCPWYAMELLGETLRDVLDDIWAGHLAALAEDVPRHSEPTLRGAALTAARQQQRSQAVEQLRPAAGGALPRILGLAVEVCDALAFLHGEGIVHRDLKPSNVLIRPSGHPVISDFGLAGSFAARLGREVLELDDGVAGSAPYMSPEQIRGELVDARSDLYAFGCLLYEMVTGQVPFSGKSPGAICSLHLDAACVPASARVEGVPATLDALVASLLEKSPQKRIGHASDVALSLREVMGELGLEVPEVRGGPPRPYLYRPELSGRQELISRFENTAVEAVLGRGGVLPVVGESGAGKTRVLLEFARRANAMGMTVIGSECAAVIAEQRRGGQAAPLTPLRPFLGFIVDQVRQTKDPALTAFVERRGAVLRRYEPRFYELEGVRRLPAAPALAAEAERGRVFAALREGFVEVSKQRSVLLVIDDLQWADELSLGMLSATGADFFARIPVLVVTAYRAEETSDELSLALRQFAKDEMAVGRLDDSSVSQMVSDMLGTPETKGRFAHSLTQVSEGNPFFVAEYLRAAVAEGLVYRQRSGAWQVTDAERDLENALGLPHSLRDLVERRIAALSPESLRVARAIAVLGREASLRVLSEVLESEPEDLSESVHHLAQRQVLTEDTPGVLRFVHDQLREVVYAKTRPGERSALHGRVAGVIERRFRNTPNFAGWYAPLAAHFEQAGRGAEAGEYFERAGAHALRVGAPKDAIFSVTRAVALASELPAQARGIRARRLRILGDAQYALGNLHEATQQYLSVLEQLGEPAPRNLRGWVGLLSRTSLQELGAAVRMRAVGRRTRPRKELAEAAMAAQRIAERYYFTNDAFRIVTASLQAAHLARRSETALSRPHFQLGIAAGVGGLTGIAERCFSAGRASARESGDDYGRIMGAYTEIAYLSGRAQWQRVWQVGAEVLPVAENLGDPHELDLLNTVLANAAAFTGDFHRSAEDFLQIRDRARARGNPVHEAWGLYARAAALIALGSHSRAVGDLEDALELLRGRSDVASEIISYGLLAQARFRSGQYEGAKAAADDAAQRIHSRMPAVYSTLHGFHRAAEVYLRLWQHSRRSDTKLQQEGLRCLRKLRLFARLMPFGTSAALQTRALVCGPAPAARLLQRAADAARGSGMPYYEATALLDLSRVSLDAEQRRRSRDAAHALFLRMGCDYDAGLCRAEA